LQDGHRSHALDLVELLVVPDEQSAGESESVDGDTFYTELFGSGHDEHPVCGEQEVVRGTLQGLRPPREADSVHQMEVGVAQLTGGLRPREAGESIDEREPRDDTDRTVELRCGQEWNDGDLFDPSGERQRDELEVLVGLARASDDAAVVETQSVDLFHAELEGGEVLQSEEPLLMLELAGDDQQVVVEHVVLVQQADVRVGDLCDEELLVERQERIGFSFLGRWGSLENRPALRVLPREVLHHPDDEGDAAILDGSKARLDRQERAASQRRLGDAQDAFP